MVKHPKIMELPAWLWLGALSAKYRNSITLANIPESEIEEEIRHFDMVWLMGVWERSPRGRDIALNHPGVRNEYRRALHDFRDEDVVGSPYSVHQYRVDPRLGGPKGLAVFRAQLAERGLGLLLDFVPNHVAIDHDWATQRPHLFIRATKDERQPRPDGFFRVGDEYIAHGKDPNFPPWTDTAQINAFSTDARQALKSTMMDIAEQCDGVRCDMAMLVTNQVFSRTWGEKAGAIPDVEFWETIIPQIRERLPRFIFMAEVYWDMEWQLLQQGFDYCYDKRLYDRMAHENADAVCAHLAADLDYQEKLVRFIENHDEDRAALVFEERSRAAAVLALTLPGAKLVHDGQTRGHRIHVPVQLGRRPREKDNEETAELYGRLMEAASLKELREGTWSLCEIESGGKLENHRQLIAYEWKLEDSKVLVIVNFGPNPIREHALIRGSSLPLGRRICRDLLGNTSYFLDGTGLQIVGVPVNLSPWNSHIYHISEIS